MDSNSTANSETLNRLERPQLRTLLFTFALSFLFSAFLFSLIQFAGPNIVDNDGYYHIKMALLMRQEGVPIDFPWLPFTLLDQDHFNDVHTLFHFLQIPFTFFGDLE